MKRHSKRVREEAALICAIAASGGVVGYEERFGRRSCVYYTIYARLGSGMAPGCLALACRVCATLIGTMPGGWTRELDAECEARIRTGWSPP